MYALIVGKDGPKLTARPADYDPAVRSSIRPMTLNAYAESLSGLVDRPVIDKTELKGEYMLSVGQSLMRMNRQALSACGLRPRRLGRRPGGCGIRPRGRWRVRHRPGFWAEARPAQTLLAAAGDRPPREDAHGELIESCRVAGDSARARVSWPAFGQIAQKYGDKYLKYKELLWGAKSFWAKCPRISLFDGRAPVWGQAFGLAAGFIAGAPRPPEERRPKPAQRAPGKPKGLTPHGL